MLASLLSAIIPSAYADPVGASAPQQGGFSFIMMFVIFFGFLYFAVWRPQNKRAREQAAMMNALAKGDEVVLAGGLLGRIIKMNDTYLTIGIANNVDVVMQKSAVISVLPKGTLKTLE